jgi:hypothetical protein
MTDHEPTRACPHRFCGTLHGINAIAALSFFAAIASSNPTVILLLLVISTLVAVAVYRLLHKQTMIESAHEAVEGRVRYEVHPGWATAAVGIDALLAAANVTLFTIACLAWQDDGPSGTFSRTDVAVVLLCGVTVTVIDQLLHRKAIRIVEPA